MPGAIVSYWEPGQRLRFAHAGIAHPDDKRMTQRLSDPEARAATPSLRVLEDFGRGQGGVPVPWWAKMAAKLVLSRLPIGYRLWARLGLFRHGLTDLDVETAVAGQLRIWREACELLGTAPRTVVEIGPGDLLAAVPAMHAAGAAEIVLVDSGDFATADMVRYRRAAAAAAAAGSAPAASRLDLSSRDAMLASASARYLTNGVASLGALASGSVDLVYSNAVLEHIRRHEFPDFLAHMYRVLAPGGVAIHQIDFKDHLGGGLNNLRLASRVWEREAVARSGFYTNRIGCAEMLDAFRNAGFAVDVTEMEVWPAVPLATARMAEEFRHRAAEDLRIAGIRLIARREAGVAR